MTMTFFVFGRRMTMTLRALYVEKEAAVAGWMPRRIIPKHKEPPPLIAMSTSTLYRSHLSFASVNFLVRPNLKRISIDNCRLESIDGTI